MWSFFSKEKKTKTFEDLSQKFEKRRSSHVEELKEKHKGALTWAKKKGIKVEEITKNSAKGLAAGVAAGAIMVSPGLSVGQELEQTVNTEKEIRKEISGVTIKDSVKSRKDVTSEVKTILEGENLYSENNISTKLTNILKIPVKAELNGIRLNKTYGIIGYESHLTRYPGENLSAHFESNLDYKKYGQASMAGGPGAWGYIASSKQLLTQRDIDREKYYLVAQTFLSPNWGQKDVKDWFRHRKIVVVNPKSGQVVVGVLEDAGPDPSTGNSFGGSPEVMEALGFSGGGSNVLFYFVDDPKDKIPLGSYGI